MSTLVRVSVGLSVDGESHASSTRNIASYTNGKKKQTSLVHSTQPLRIPDQIRPKEKPPGKMPPTKHHIRQASSMLQDGARILSFTDSQLSHLASIGSGEQWGTESISANPASQEKYKNLVIRSEEPQSWGKNWVDVSILEIEVDLQSLPTEIRGLVTTAEDGESCRLPIAAMVLEGHSSDYTRPVIAEQDAADPFVYVRYLVTDRRVGAFSKGSGQMLLAHAEAVARSLGVGRLTLDGWSGNGEVLVR